MAGIYGPELSKALMTGIMKSLVGINGLELMAGIKKVLAGIMTKDRLILTSKNSFFF